MVGDNVEILCDGDTGVIERIYPRKSQIIRPVVANVTQSLVVFSIRKPEINTELLNKMLINCQYNNLKIIVCINKLDLGVSEDERNIVDMIKSIGYEILFLKGKRGNRNRRGKNEIER